MNFSRVFPRSAPSRGVTALALAALTLLPAACHETSSKPPATTPPGGQTDTTRQELLRASGECVLATAREFQTRAGELEERVRRFAAASDADIRYLTRGLAREAWGRAMDTWQQLEVMQVGPLAPRNQPGGGDVRDNIYSWPLINRCSIEEQIVSKGYESASFSNTLVTRRGLYALEYLLFYPGKDTACGPSSPIVSSGSWAALSDVERENRKADYALVLAKDVRARADGLVQAWDPSGGNFQNTLASAGPGNSTFPSTQRAMNALSDALFYVESYTKDQKLARPLGLRECEGSTCPEYLESVYAQHSKENLRANLVGFRRIFEGCGTDYAGVGFDDVLVAAGSETLAVKLHDRVVAAQAALEAIKQPTLTQALEENKPSVRALYDSLKGLTDVLKTEMVSVLDLELPSTLEGDND